MTALMQTDCKAARYLGTLHAILEAMGDDYEIVERPNDEMNDYLRSIQSSFDAKHISGDGRGLHFSFDRYQRNGRLTVSPQWPADCQRHNYRGEVDSITVDYGRRVESLAADIQRRLLVPYAAEFAHQQARAEASDSKRAKQLALAVKIGDIIGCSCRDRQTGEPRDSWHPMGLTGFYRIDVHSDCGVKLETEYNLPAEVAVDLARFIAARMAKYRADHPAGESE